MRAIGTYIVRSWEVSPQTPLVSLRSGLRMPPYLFAVSRARNASHRSLYRAFLGGIPPDPAGLASLGPSYASLSFRCE
jgi:hypothetical protein